MKKQTNIFECQNCGAHSLKWSGKCVNCNSWDSMIEIKKPVKKDGFRDFNPDFNDLNLKKMAFSTTNAIPLHSIELNDVDKFSSKESEFDIVLGGGVVAGGLYLIGGSPGVGKSTLLLKISNNLAKDKNVLYVSGEESPSQIRLRVERIFKIEKQLYLLNSIDLETIESNIRNSSYEICVIDSIQTMYSSEISSAPGSVSQVRECTFLLLRLAKELNISIFIIGHITKEGMIAGPRILEHIVDCVLYFDGDASREFRILRSFKNRFGATNEVGIFEMTNEGLISAKNASIMFLKERKSCAGSAISVVLEGSRPLVLEIQALVTQSLYPKRSATGFELNRLNMILALLEKKLDFPLGKYDVFINIVGGIKVSEPALDLALVAAIISSFKNRPLSVKSAFIGEVSLVGDIRDVSRMDTRLRELASYGFSNVIIPKKPKSSHGLKIFEAPTLAKLLDWM